MVTGFTATYPPTAYNPAPMTPKDEELKEIFALFTSPTLSERQEAYNPSSAHYFLNENLQDEYELTEEKREYALDAWRAVMYFLHRNGFKLYKDGEETNLEDAAGFLP